MENSIKNRLDELVGQTIHFEKQNITIEKYKEVAGNICIVTNARTFQFYPNEIENKFLEKISEKKEEAEYNPPTEIEKKIFIALPEENHSIKSTLMDALKQVKENPSFLAQAKAICEITNAMVNVQKTEIEMIKIQKDL